MAIKGKNQRGMNADELIAQATFHQMGFTQIRFEPDGNSTPDFLLNNRIAVEVRRLNQNTEQDGKNRGLEETFSSFLHGMQALLHQMSEPDGESWWVTFSFSRPVEPWAALKPRIKEALAEFKTRPIRTNCVIFSSGKFWLEVAKASVVSVDDPMFYYLIGDDGDAGGVKVPEIIRNAEICSKLKIAKTAEHRSKYPEWWLLLVNQFGLEMDDFDKQQLKAHFKCPKGWDKLVIVNVEPNDWIEFPASPA